MRGHQIRGPIENGNQIRLEVPRNQLERRTLFPESFVNASRDGALVCVWNPPWYRKSATRTWLLSTGLALPGSTVAVLGLLGGSRSGDGGRDGREPGAGERPLDGKPSGDAETSYDVTDFVLVISIAVALTIILFIVIYVLPRRRDQRRREEEAASELT